LKGGIGPNQERRPRHGRRGKKTRRWTQFSNRGTEKGKDGGTKKKIGGHQPAGVRGKLVKQSPGIHNGLA